MNTSTSNNSSTRELAWKYFELHANQRISLIRFYIFILSFYVTGSSYLVAKFNDNSCVEEYGVVFFSVIFIIISVLFWKLDQRNMNLIHIAEKSLRKFERDTENLAYTHKIFIREKNTAHTQYRHTFCFNVLFTLAIISALIILVYSWDHSYPPNNSTLDRAPIIIHINN